MEDYKGFDNKFNFVKTAAQRAKQILRGSRKLVDSRAQNPLTIALEEMRNGLVTPENINSLQEDNLFFNIDRQEGEGSAQEILAEGETPLTEEDGLINTEDRDTPDPDSMPKKK